MKNAFDDYSLVLVLVLWLVAFARATVGLFASQYVRDADGQVRAA